MTNNVYKILDDIKDFLRAGEFTNTVSFGDIADIDLDKTTIFPLAHINISAARFTESTITFDINLMCMDILDENNLSVDEYDYFYGNDNLQDVLNSQLAVMSRLFTELTRGSLRDELLTIEDDLTAEPFKDRFVNVLAGWTSTIPLVIQNTTSLSGNNSDGTPICDPDA
jgi:hypothetical protein|tara:strand:+ start:1255 stop:1761 length:507 start_codon:yes stop_codon:yes gene_type:complete